jgi:hypothetical protein
LQALLTHINRSNWLALLLVILGTFFIIYLSIPELLLSPNDFLLVSEGDGLKSYYVFDYQLNYQTTFNHFAGLNYPYGDSYLYTDGFPALQAIMQYIPFLKSYHVGIIHLTLIIGFILTSVFLFLILNFYTHSRWISIIGALCIFSLQPQFIRLFGHLSLAYSCVIPMGWYFLLRFIQDKNKLKWSFLLFFTNSLWFFTHGYLGLMLTLFLGIVVIFHFKLWKNLRYFIQIMAFLGVPLLLFFLISKWSNSVQDRTTEPFGFFEYQAQWKSVFLPSEGFIHDQIEKCISFTQVNWEGFAYIGLTSLLLMLFLLFFSIYSFFKQKELTILPRELWFFLISGIVLLIYSFGIPFNQFPSLLDVFGPLKQFRAIGRFAWPFYFVCGVISFVLMNWLYLQAKTKFKKQIALVFIMFGSVTYFWEASEILLKKRNYSKNTFLIENVSADHRELIQFIQKHKNTYQCILPIPWFHVGSELYSKEPNIKTMGNTLIASAHTGLPLYSCMMGRTSFRQSFDFFRSLGSNFQDKHKSTLINEKDFLIWYDYQKIYAEDEQELLNASTIIYKNKMGELRSISPTQIFERKKSIVTPIIDTQNETRADFLFENYDSKNKRLTAKVTNYNTIAQFESGILKPDKWYEVSFDYYWIGKKNLDNVFRIEFVKNKQINWFYERTISSYTDQQKDKVRVRAVFKTQSDPCAYNFFLFGGEKKNSSYHIDHLLIRPLDLSVRWKDDKGQFFINSFPEK